MATYHKQLIAALAIGVVAVGSLVYVSRTPSAKPSETDRVRVVEDPKPPSQWAINAAYGRGALSNLRAAFTELANGNPEQARMGIVVARSLLTKIDPKQIHAIDVSEGGNVSILVHSEVRVLDDIESEQIIESKLDDIRSDVDMNDSEAVEAALRELQIPLTYTHVDLPLEETINGIDQVLEALNSNDTERARAMLARIGDGLRIDTVRIEGPELPQAALTEDDAG